ncbi:unnamed protein product [Sphagnum balticum]
MRHHLPARGIIGNRSQINYDPPHQLRFVRTTVRKKIQLNQTIPLQISLHAESQAGIELHRFPELHLTGLQPPTTDSGGDVAPVGGLPFHKEEAGELDVGCGLSQV